MFENVNGRTNVRTAGRRLDWYKLTFRSFGSGELKNTKCCNLNVVKFSLSLAQGASPKSSKQKVP